MHKVTCIAFSLVLASPVLSEETAFQPAACPFEGAAELDGVECGVLTVPERRDTPGGRTLELAVAVLRSHDPDPAPDPLVFLSGGPGDSSVEHVPSRAGSPFWNRLRRQRDLVFFDQRGTGYSEPTFCPEMDTAFASVNYQGLSEAEARAEKVRAAAACREQMLAQGVDLSAYHSAASAGDLADLRRGLGYESWNLLGVSYGTRLALTVLRDEPDGVRSAILDSTLPPDVTNWTDSGERFSRVLRLAFDQCAAAPRCRAAFSSLEADFYAVVADLEEDPIVLAFSDTSRFPDGRVVLDGTAWTQGVFQGFYNRSFVPVFPLIVQESKRRNRLVLRALADQLAKDTDTTRFGMHYAVNCHEVAPFSGVEEMGRDRRRNRRLGPWFEAGPSTFHAVCDALQAGRADASHFRPVRSAVPALILTGELDPVTPPSYGRRAARTLTNATFVEVPAMGHAVSPHSDCTQGLIESFLAAPGLELDTSCVAGLPPLSFVTDVHLNGGVHRFASALRSGGIPLLIVGLLGVGLLWAVVGWPAAVLVRRLRGRTARASAARGESVASALAASTAAVALAFLVGLAAVVKRTAEENILVLAFGVPRGAAWLFALPWVVAALTLGVVALAALAWRRGWWSPAGRIHYAIAVAACVGFVALVASWGLL